MSNVKPTSKEEWITAEDGHEIFTKTWFAVGTPLAAVVFVHGLGEHIVPIPDITAALERGKIEGLPLFLMGHSY
ncbi:hypothetical protein BGZ96_001704, partial [Linnemannia gamsii]